MSEGFTLDHTPLPLEKLTGEYAEKSAKESAPKLAPAPPAPVMGYCAHCQKQLPRRSRADAQYCSDAHRKAAARKAAKIAEANKAFKTDLSIAANSHRAAELAGEYSWFATSMNREAKRSGIDVAFLPMLHGVLITEDSPGSVMLATSTSSFSDFGRFVGARRAQHARQFVQNGPSPAIDQQPTRAAGRSHFSECDFLSALHGAQFCQEALAA